MIPSTGPRAAPDGVTRRAMLAGLPLLLVALTACGDDEPAGRAAQPSDDGGAAEPAIAPEPSADPAGTVVEVGSRPQGIVYDAATGTLAVAARDPYRLLLLDPTTLAERRAVALPGKVRHLQLGAGGGTVLVPCESAEQVVQVPIAGGEPVVTDVERQPHDAAGAGNGDVVVGNEFSGSISFVRDGRTLDTVADLRQPGGVVVVGRVVAVIDVGDYTLSTYDLRTRRRTGRVAAGAGPTHLVALGGRTGEGRVVVADTRGDALLVYSLDPLRQVARLPLAGTPYGLAADATGVVWVTLTLTNELVGVSLTGARPREIARFPTVRQPDTVAVRPDGSTLWVTGTVDGVVQRVSRP